jgi:hypothetical protein
MNCYVVRTDSYEASPDEWANVKQKIFEQLKSGSSRFGWSYDDNLNLERIIESEKSGAWESLSAAQKDAWYGHGFVDRASIGDLLFYPNIPKYGEFCIAEISDRYEFLDAQKGIDGDFRSSRGCRLITTTPIQKSDAIVPPSIRNKIGLQRRFYGLYVDDEDVTSLLDNLKNQGRATGDYKLYLANMTLPHYQNLAREWPRFFPKADLSRALESFLKLRGETGVDLREGPSESGADLVIEVSHPFLDRPIVIGIQVGSYEGSVGATTVREKLNQLLNGWSDNSLDYGCLVLTGEWTEAAREELRRHNETEKRKVKGIDGEGLARMLLQPTWLM